MIKRVLIYTYGDQSHKAAIHAAAAFASHHGARIIGVFVQPEFSTYTTIYGEQPLNLASTFYDLQKSYSQRVHAEFEKAVAQFECASQWIEFSDYENRAKPPIYTDVIFTSQPNTESSVIFNDTDFVDRLVLETGLPIFIIPKNWSGDSFAQRPVLGWKETKEAGAAARGSLTIMREAKQVDVVTIEKKIAKDEGLTRGIGIMEYLSEHAINCKYYYQGLLNSEHCESDALLRHVKNHQCDLIIIGGYGHSRLREIILGGMTRDLIKYSPVPIMMSH